MTAGPKSPKSYTLPSRLAILGERGSKTSRIPTPINQLHEPRFLFKRDSKAVNNYKYTKKVGSYLLGDCLGKGSFARVNEALHILTGEKVAVKVIEKSRCSTDAYVRRTLRREGRLLQQLKHPNLIQLLEILETEHAYYLALELCPGEGLLGRIGGKGKLSEATARRYIIQLMSGVAYMHRQGVMHRDLKVENILLSEDDAVKIIDFGLSTQVRPPITIRGNNTDRSGNLTSRSNLSTANPLTAREAKKEPGELDGANGLCKTQCGSPAYAAPEVLGRKPYGLKADVWSIGVNLFAMIAGLLPFSVRPFSITALCQKMLAKEMSPLPTGISSACVDLIHRLLDPNAETRINLREAQRHPWLTGPGPSLNSLRIQINSELPLSTSDLNELHLKDFSQIEASFLKENENLSSEIVEDPPRTERDVAIVAYMADYLVEHLPSNCSVFLGEKRSGFWTSGYNQNNTDRMQNNNNARLTKDQIEEVVRQILSNTPGPVTSVFYLLSSKAKRYCHGNGVDFIDWLKHFHRQETQKLLTESKSLNGNQKTEEKTLESGGTSHAIASHSTIDERSTILTIPHSSREATLLRSSSPSTNTNTGRTCHPKNLDIALKQLRGSKVPIRYATMQNLNESRSSNPTRFYQRNQITKENHEIVLDQNANYLEPKSQIRVTGTRTLTSQKAGSNPSTYRHTESPLYMTKGNISKYTAPKSNLFSARDDESLRRIVGSRSPAFNDVTAMGPFSARYTVKPTDTANAWRYNAEMKNKNDLNEEYLRLPLKASIGAYNPQTLDLKMNRVQQSRSPYIFRTKSPTRINSGGSIPLKTMDNQQYGTLPVYSSGIHSSPRNTNASHYYRRINSSVIENSHIHMLSSPEPHYKDKIMELSQCASPVNSSRQDEISSKTVTGVNGLLRKWRVLEKTNSNIPMGRGSTNHLQISGSVRNQRFMEKS